MSGKEKSCSGCTSSKLALELWSISMDSDRLVSCGSNSSLVLTFYTTRNCTTEALHSTKRQQLPPTCLVLAVAAGLLIFTLWFIRRLVAGGAWARQVGVRGQVATGDQRAHVDVVGKDVVTNELTEEQDQVGELHSLAFVAGLGCRGERRGAELLNDIISLDKSFEINLNRHWSEK